MMRRFVLVLGVLCAGLLAGAVGAAPAREIPLAVNDLAWEPASGRLWASVRGAGAYENTIVAIDPVTGTLGPSLAMGGEAGPLAVSDDGSTLYVGVASAAVIRRVDFATRTVVSSFGLGSDPQFGPLYALDIAAQPGHPNVVAVTRQNGMVSTSNGVAIFDDGAMRAARTPTGYVGRRIVFNSVGDRLYAIDDGTTSGELETIRVDAAGATLLATTSDFRTAGSHFANGWLIGGHAFDPAINRLRGAYRVPAGPVHFGGVEVDATLAEVYRATSSGIVAFDLDRFTPVGFVAVPFFQGIDVPFVRWGTRSFAFSVPNANVPTLIIVDGTEFLADIDIDFVVDAIDNCPEMGNATQLDADADGVGDVCDSTPRPDPFPALQQCAGALAAEQLTVSQRLAEFAQAQAQFAQLSVEVNQCIAANDADGDGEPNITDRCPGSLDFADPSGCSRQQFCSVLPSSQCDRGDWLNDQPGVKKPFDCRRVGGACAAY